MAMTKKEIQDKSDKKRGVKMKGFKLHEDTIALLEELSIQTDLSQTHFVTEGIKKMQEIKIYISSLCKLGNFFTNEYAGFLYDALNNEYPSLNLHIVVVNEHGSNICREFPYIVKVEINLNQENLQKINNIIHQVCSELVEKCKNRKLHSNNGLYKDETIYKPAGSLSNIYNYLINKGVSFGSLGY